MNKKIGIISLGCSKNLVDSENMLGLLDKKGYEITEDFAQADAIIVNTCAFIESAKKESIDAIFEAAKYKEKGVGRCKALICAGCLSERYKDEIMKEIPELDAVLGVNDIDKIVNAVSHALKGEKNEFFSATMPEKTLPRIVTTPRYTAFLKIAEGCDNFCSYCAIPYIRGRYKSRSMDSIIKEAKHLVSDGAKELIVIAQDTSKYGVDLYGEKKLPELLKKLCAINGAEWIRVHYCYPEEITEELIKTIKEEKKIVKYLDIPIQHCNDRILKKMNRKTTGAAIKKLIEHLRDEIPEIVIRTSLIAGFPGETEEEFAELLDFVREIKFDRLGAFAYSSEEGTPAAKMDSQLPEEVKEERAGLLMEAQKEVSKELGERRIGQVLRVLTEGFDDENYLYFGRSYADSADVDARVYFGAEYIPEPGEFVNVKILDYADYDLTGEMINE